MPHNSVPPNERALAQAETIAHQAKRVEIERLVKDCERSEIPILRSLANAYRLANPGNWT